MNENRYKHRFKPYNDDTRYTYRNTKEPIFTGNKESAFTINKRKEKAMEKKIIFRNF